MEILVHQLTRMGPGRICVAGLDVATGQHVRPVLPFPGLDARLADEGPFAIGGRVDLGPVAPSPTRPRIEDVRFDPALARRVATVGGGELWRVAREVARHELTALFGPDLLRLGVGSMACRPGSGAASLGVWAPPAPPVLRVTDNRVRLRVRVGSRELDLSVTDRRFWMPDHERANGAAVAEAAARIIAGAPVLLGVGLTREYEGQMWLQVNSVLIAPPGVN